VTIQPGDECARILIKRGQQLPNGGKATDDILCDKYGVTDVIVTFNGLRYVVPLCGEHKAHHDAAAAERRSQRSGAARREADKRANDRRIAHVRSQRTSQAQAATRSYESLLDKAMTRTGRR
jgi:hypothetical protein